MCVCVSTFGGNYCQLNTARKITAESLGSFTNDAACQSTASLGPFRSGDYPPEYPYRRLSHIHGVDPETLARKCDVCLRWFFCFFVSERKLAKTPKVRESRCIDEGSDLILAMH